MKESDVQDEESGKQSKEAETQQSQIREHPAPRSDVKQINWKKILKIVGWTAAGILVLILAYHLILFVISLVMTVVGWIISAVQYVLIGFVALLIWRLMPSNQGHASGRRHSSFLSDARDNIPSAKNQVPHAEDQVGSAMDHVSHILRSDRDRRRGR